MSRLLRQTRLDRSFARKAVTVSPEGEVTLADYHDDPMKPTTMRRLGFAPLPDGSGRLALIEHNLTSTKIIALIEVHELLRSTSALKPGWYWQDHRELGWSGPHESEELAQAAAVQAWDGES